MGQFDNLIVSGAAAQQMLTGVKEKFDDVNDTLDGAAYIGEGDGSALIPDFDPQTDTVWKKQQTLSSAEKTQVLTNLGINGWPDALGNAKSVTYSALKTLRDNSNLIAGQFYRITDYTTTTALQGTQSAGHAFDVIVLATATNKLDENARAIQHAGDTYFANSKLEAWQLKYCLDNDANRFAWADTTNGKGVIYWLKDEYDNECPYDFKNIMFARYQITAFAKVPSLVNTYNGFADITSPSSKYPQEATLGSTAVYRYTFDRLSGTTSSDITVYQTSQTRVVCYENSIEAYFISNQKKQTLNNITIGGSSFDLIYGNSFGANNRNWAIGYQVYGNHIGTYCYNNSVGDYFQNNSVGESFIGNSVGNYFQNNNVGNDFDSNSVGNYFQNNNVGNGLQYNSVGNYLQGNLFGDDIKGADFTQGFSGKNIAPIGLSDFDYDYGNWEEEEDEETGDTLLSGFYDGYLNIGFADEVEQQCHVYIAVKHAGGVEVVYDNDITTEPDGTYAFEELSATWDACSPDDVVLVFDVTWTDGGVTQRKTDNSTW